MTVYKALTDNEVITQAIITKFIPATNTRPHRIKAFCNAGSLIISFPDQPVRVAHRIAAEALREKLGWDDPSYGQMIGGGMPVNVGDYVWVFDNKKIEK